MQQQQASPAADTNQRMSGPPRPQQRVKRLDPPNKVTLNEEVGGLQIQIEALQQRIGEIKATLDNRAQNRHIASPEQMSARNKLADLNASFQAAVEKKRLHREELDLIKEKLRSSGGSRLGLPEVKVEELDEQIRKLEYRQTHTTLPIDEEKRLISQIERLKKSRESLRRHDSRSEQDQGLRTELIDLIKQDEQELNLLKTAQDEQRRILSDIRSKEAALALDIPALLEEKNASYEKIKGLRDQIKQLRVDFSVKEDEYWKREREFRAQQVLERKSKAEKGRAEWLEREKVRKQRAMDNFVEPYTDEIILCEQLISYMVKSMPVEEGTTLPQQQQKADITAPEGFGVALVSKKNRNEDDLDGWFAGCGGKKGKKSKGPTPSKSRVREKIALSIDALSSFEKVTTPPPTTYGDVPKSLENLRKKKEQFLKMQTKAREVRERGDIGNSLVGDMADDVVSVASGPDDRVSLASGEEALLGTESESGSCAEREEPSDELLGVNSMHTSALSGAEVGSSVEQDDLELIDQSTSIIDSTATKDIVPLDDKAHMETFEFSEAAKANLDLENVALKEHVAELEITTPISETGLQNGVYKEVLYEASIVKEGVAENGGCALAADCGVVDVMPATVAVVPERLQVTHSVECKAETVSKEVLKVGVQVGDSADVFGRVEGFQLAESDSQHEKPVNELEDSLCVASPEESDSQQEKPVNELEDSLCVASPQDVRQKASLNAGDDAAEPSARNGELNGTGEERLPLP